MEIDVNETTPDVDTERSMTVQKKKKNLTTRRLFGLTPCRFDVNRNNIPLSREKKKFRPEK